MKRLWLGVFALLLACAAWADGPQAARKRIEASMLVTGTVTVAPDGSVGGYQLDHPDRLPAPVVELIGKNVPNWRFEPARQDGKPVTAKAKMSLRVVAVPVAGGDDQFALGIRATHFGERRGNGGITYKDVAPPRYPPEAIRGRMQGTAYLLLKIDRQGRVADAIAEQVNLGALAGEREMQAWREVLARASLQAAMHWTYNVPADGAGAVDGYWYAHVPIEYRLNQERFPGDTGGREDRYGKWDVYVPGPFQPAPWFDKDKMLSGIDAVPDGAVSTVGDELTLLTPPSA